MGRNSGPAVCGRSAGRGTRYLNWYLLSRAAAVSSAFNFFGLRGRRSQFRQSEAGQHCRRTGPCTATGTRTHPRWEVRPDATAPSRPNVFEQLSTTPSDADFPLAIFDKVICRDGDLSVKFKIRAGRGGSRPPAWSGGIRTSATITCCASASTRRNIALFRVQDGQMRADIPAVPHDLRAGQWYVAKVIFRGPHFRVFVRESPAVRCHRRLLATPGKTGFGPAPARSLPSTISASTKKGEPGGRAALASKKTLCGKLLFEVSRLWLFLVRQRSRPIPSS